METWNFLIDLVPYFVVYLRQETLWIDYHLAFNQTHPLSRTNLFHVALNTGDLALIQ